MFPGVSYSYILFSLYCLIHFYYDKHSRNCISFWSMTRDGVTVLYKSIMKHYQSIKTLYIISCLECWPIMDYLHLLVNMNTFWNSLQASEIQYCQSELFLSNMRVYSSSSRTICTSWNCMCCICSLLVLKIRMLSKYVVVNLLIEWCKS